MTGGDGVKSVELGLECCNARRLIDLDRPPAVSKTAAAQSQAYVDKPLARQIADQRRACTQGRFGVDDNDTVVVIHDDFEPALTNGRKPPIREWIEIEMAAGGFILLAKLIGFGNIETVEGSGQPQATMAQGAASVYGTLMLGR